MTGSHCAADIHPAHGPRGIARDALTRPPRQHLDPVLRLVPFLASHGIIGHGLLSAQRLDSLTDSDWKRFRSRMPRIGFGNATEATR